MSYERNLGRPASHHEEVTTVSAVSTGTTAQCRNGHSAAQYYPLPTRTESYSPCRRQEPGFGHPRFRALRIHI